MSRGTTPVMVISLLIDIAPALRAPVVPPASTNGDYVRPSVWRKERSDTAGSLTFGNLTPTIETMVGF
ncbi:MAG: hypothetical protein NVSMB22_21190 [Chloroflexota bacterium]